MKQELVRAQPRALDVQPQRSPSLLALQRVCEEGAEVRCDGNDVGGRLRRTRLSVKIVTPPDYCAVGFECETVPDRMANTITELLYKEDRVPCEKVSRVEFH